MSIPPIPKKIPKLPAAAAAKIPTTPKRPNLPGSSAIPTPVSPATPAAPATPTVGSRVADLRSKAGQVTGPAGGTSPEPVPAELAEPAGKQVTKTTLRQDVKDAALGNRTRVAGEKQSVRSAVLEVGARTAAGAAKGAASGASKGAVAGGVGAAPGAALGAALGGAKELAFSVARNGRLRGILAGALVIAVSVPLALGGLQAAMVANALSGISSYNDQAAQQSALTSSVEDVDVVAAMEMQSEFGIPWTVIASIRQDDPEATDEDFVAVAAALEDTDPSRLYRSMDAGGVYSTGDTGRIINEDDTSRAPLAEKVKETYVAALTAGVLLDEPAAEKVYDRALGWWLGQQQGCTTTGSGSGGETGSLTVKGNPMTPEQEAIARTIIGITKTVTASMPAADQVRAAEISMATGIVESVLTNHDKKVDHTSLGVFQQQDWWGTDEQRTRPDWATARFLKPLLTLAGWNTMDPGTAAQMVQISAFPDEYSKRMDEAKAIVSTFWSTSPALPLPADSDMAGVGAAHGAPTTTVCMTVTGMWVYPFNGTPTINSWFGPRKSPGGIGSTNHQGVDFGVPFGDPILSASNGTVTGKSTKVDGCGYWITIAYDGDAEARYCHMKEPSPLSVGDQVTAGQEIGLCGSTGNSTGAHLHFNVNIAGEPVDPTAFMLKNGVDFTTLPRAGGVGPY